MALESLFSGQVHVHYGQAYVESRDDFGTDLHEAFAGQTNGLCGATVPGFMFLITGLHTGHVGFAVERHEAPPPLDDSWEEIVEVSFRPASPEVALVQWAGEDSWDLDLKQIDYRVRYCATGMDQAHAADGRMDDEPQLDRYLLQFWPAPPEPDCVVKQTGGNAAYWHGFASGLPPPPSPEERAEKERLARLEEQRALEECERAAEASLWGGRLPSERLRRLGGNVIGMVELDRDLAEAIADTPPDRQRQIARWATHRAYEVAGLTGVDWIAPALRAMDEGRRLPAPFDDFERVWDVLFNDARVPQTTVTLPGKEVDNFSQQAAAVPALFGAVEPDPLQAALDALYAAAAAFGTDYRTLFEQARGTFDLQGQA